MLAATGGHDQADPARRVCFSKPSTGGTDAAGGWGEYRRRGLRMPRM